MIRIGFFGTPELSARVLQDFLDSPDYEVVFVVTGEDKPVGRHQVLTANPVKTLTIKHNLPILQPARIRGNTDFLEMVASYEADYFVVVAYGKILPKELLELPKKYPINIHGSILPKYRGASPIQASLIAGDVQTWVTIMVMNEKMDEGNTIDAKIIEIWEDETTETLFEKFAKISGDFAIKTIQKLDQWAIVPKIQDEAQVTYCKKITKEEGLLDFHKNAKELYHLYQGFTPWPGTYTVFKWKKLIVEKCFFSPLLLGDEPGVRWTVIRQENEIWIICGKWLLTLSQVKLEWKKSQNIKEFLNGQRDFIGSVL